ncbi:hypothetical protein JUJ52_22750 [Virgibacillus sp. AGTR]|uniref:hypothetical protein n=1 Tax=Virgibacillus sp. AGTR TaxID=2812055 RepID=UPI001D167D58|nr:hypothetical protein [Virgibacillus sp. AGTR]MCC2252745.1 hypothetical protein [Virgibacillus sp. AGTR]
MKLKSFKLISILFVCVIPFVILILAFINIVLYLGAEMKFYALELSIPMIVSLLIGYFISETADEYEIHLFYKYHSEEKKSKMKTDCSSQNLVPVISVKKRRLFTLCTAASFVQRKSTNTAEKHAVTIVPLLFENRINS